jgi:vacuolar-type H+-ATPase subunit I/STV1
MSSIGSSMSMMSISHRGEEVDLEKALDEIFKDLQTNLNHTHCKMREIAMLEDQGDDDFKQVSEMCWSVEDNIIEMNDLFTELKDVLKQIRGKTPVAEKDWFKMKTDQRKNEYKESKSKKKDNLNEIKE